MTPRRLVVSAPGRANLIGNPSDQYGGCQVSCSLPLRARVRMEASEETVLRCGEETQIVRSDADLALRGDLLDLGRAVLEATTRVSSRRAARRLPHASIHYESEIPLRSGLAGSTALVVALLHALLTWRGERPGGHLLAEAARHLERHDLGIVCGFGDQYMAVFGGLRFLEFRGKAHGAPGEESCLATVEDLAPFVRELPFVLAFTGVGHASSAVHAPIRERWLAGERTVVEGYERIAALGALGKRALLAGDHATLGAAMNENHAIQRDFGGSGASNERLIAAALAAGASAAKLAGAGQGGTIVALWTDPDATPLERALRAAGAETLLRPQPVTGVLSEVGDLPA